MDLLPVELLRNVIEKLDVSSIKALRLTSRLWASLGEDYLIHSTFNTLPHRKSSSTVQKGWLNFVQDLILVILILYHYIPSMHKKSNIFT